ncbi:xylulokinase [Bacillus sp. FSL K6-3431]|uniref:xylulokinase n=1 Tax=Bacillus sp. FSL K6-3431 TaxID=2921500 RepID=UPI0030F579DE
MQCVAAFDLGTTAIKGCLLTREGQNIAEHTINLNTNFGENGELEQNPEEWWKVIQIITNKWFNDQGIRAEDIQAISFSGQMEDVIIINDNQVTTRAILYSDTRASAEAEIIREQLPELEKITGNKIAASTPFAKLLWMQKNDLEFGKQQRSVVFSAKDYILYKLTGAIVSDYITSATTGLMNLKTRQWEPDLLQTVGIHHINLPQLTAPDKSIGNVSAYASQLTGFVEGTPVLCGSGDAGASTIGAGAINEGDCYLYLGTTGWVAVPTADPTIKPSGIFTLAHMVPNLNIAIAPLLNVGNVHRWAMHSFLAQENYDLYEACVMETEPGANGLLCLPYMYGERSPVIDNEAKGAFWGIGPSTRTPDFLRAVLEGISLSLRQIMEMLMNEENGNITLIGGGAQSKVWCQILADVTQKEVRVPGNTELLPAYGAASSAFLHLGWVKSYSEFVHTFILSNQADRYIPNKETEDTYDHAYERYLKLYPLMKNIYS